MLNRQKVIAIIDDDPLVLQGTDQLLKALGFRTECYASAEAFIDAAMKSEASCLVVDMHMGGMTGLEMGYQLSTMGLTLPIIFVTGSQDDAVRKGALEFGCVAYLSKPYRSEVLTKALADAIGELPEPGARAARPAYG